MQDQTNGRITSDAPPSAAADEAWNTFVQNTIGERKGLRTLQEILDGLSVPIPQVYLGEKTKGGRKITIFDWMLAQDMLDYWAPGWQSYGEVQMSGERVTHTTRICIPTSDRGIVCRSASGDDSEDEDETPEFDLTTDEGVKAEKKWRSEQGQREYGSPTTRAEGQSFKRACARFGLGMHLRRRKPIYQGPVQAKQEKPGPNQLDGRFRDLWNKLRTFGWTDPQITAQYAQIAGKDKFADLPPQIKTDVVARLSELISVEEKRVANERKARDNKGLNKPDINEGAAPSEETE